MAPCQKGKLHVKLKMETEVQYRSRFEYGRNNMFISETYIAISNCTLSSDVKEVQVKSIL